MTQLWIYQIIRPLRNHTFLIVWYDFDFWNSNFRCKQRMHFWGFNNAMLSSIHILEEEESELCIELFIQSRHIHILVYMWTSVTHHITCWIPGMQSQNPSHPLIPLSKVKSMHSTLHAGLIHWFFFFKLYLPQKFKRLFSPLLLKNKFSLCFSGWTKELLL